MDRISDSGSDGCGSIPHGGTNFKQVHLSQPFYPSGLAFFACYGVTLRYIDMNVGTLSQI